jgi:hypothetical protein
MQIKSLKTAVFVVAMVAMVLLALTRPGSTPRPAYACTGGWLTLEELVHASAAVAAVEALSVGSGNNSEPTLTPTPTSSAIDQATPTPTISPRWDNSSQRSVDLAGIGARVELEHPIIGSVPSHFDVDMARRANIERQIRRMEANPLQITPCPLDFLVSRFTAGQKYVVFLGQDQSGNWSVLDRFPVSGTAVQGRWDEGGLALSVSSAVYRAFFSGLEAEPRTSLSDDPNEQFWHISAQNVSLDLFAEAVRAIHAGSLPQLAAATGTPPPTRTPPPASSPRITAPDTGDGGLH